jgi:hypothetical protein
LISNRTYELEEFLNKFVKIYDYQIKGTDRFGCKGKPMDDKTALVCYNELTERVKMMLGNERIQSHRNFVMSTCDRDCWCWDLENEIMELEKKYYE